MDDLFATLMQKHSLNDIYKMDLNEFLRLINRKQTKQRESRQVDSLFAAFGK